MLTSPSKNRWNFCLRGKSLELEKITYTLSEKIKKNHERKSRKNLKYHEKTTSVNGIPQNNPGTSQNNPGTTQNNPEQSRTTQEQGRTTHAGTT